MNTARTRPRPSQPSAPNSQLLLRHSYLSTRNLIIALTLAAFALRLYHLASPSLRGDEAFDVLFARQSLPELLHQFRFVQPYPPLFHVGLHFWLPLAGRSEFAIRFWAAGCATLVVPAIYILGAQLFGRREGLVAALLTAVNPFVQWWGQDAHFYAYLLAVATLLTVVTLRFWRSTEFSNGRFRRVGALYVLVALISFLAHYFAYFVWGALNVVAAVQTLRRRWSPTHITQWWGAQAVLVAVYLPWVILTLPVTSSYVEPWIERTTPWTMAWRNLFAFSLGYTPPLPPPDTGGNLISATINSGLVGLMALLFALGILFGWRHLAYRSGLMLVMALILIPFTTVYLASFHRPIFDEKLTIFMLPFYLILLASGIVGLARRWRWAGRLAGLGAILVMSLANYQYFTNEAYAKSPAWREMLDYIHHKAQPGDLLIYNFPEPAIIFYNDSQLPLELIPGSAGLNSDEIGANIEEALAGYSRVWLVPLVQPWWDARGDVVTWLDRHADRRDQRFFRGIHASLYLTPTAWQALMQPQPVAFAGGIQLNGFRLAVAEADMDRPVLSPGDTLHLSLYWQADGPSDIPYTVFTHLVGPDGALYGQWDNPPVRGTYPTTQWSTSENVVDQYEIPVSPDAPPGEYRLLVGLYDPASGARLVVLGDKGQTMGDSIQIDQDFIVR